MRKALLPALGAVAIVALAACSSVGSSNNDDSGDNVGQKASDVRAGGTLTLALSADPDILDPTLARSLYSRYIFHTMCEKLYDLDADAKVVPQLASDMPTVSDDGLTVTIPLRDGVKFADGTDFNAAAVKKTLERDLNLDTSARKSELGPIDSIDATDATTVTVHLSAPFAPLTAALADRAGMIMSPKALDELGEDFGTDPVCVGPFKFAERVPQNSITVERDPNYYDADKVHLDKIVYQVLTDANIRANNLKSGDAEVADTVSTQDVADLKNTDGITVLESSSLGYQGITFNVGNANGVGQPPGDVATPLASDPRIRQAFEYAIDRQSIAEDVFNGLFDPACSPISPATQYTSDAAQTCREHDPDKAKDLLNQAGVDIPFPITMKVTNTPDTLRLAQAIKAMVTDGGFNVTIDPVEFTTLLDQQDAGDFEMLQLGWSGRVDPDANMTNFVGTQGSQNVSGFSDPEVDSLLDQARTEQDPTARADLYGQAVTKIAESDPLIYLYRQRNLTGVSDKVSGVQVFPDGIIRVAFAGFVA